MKASKAIYFMAAVLMVLVILALILDLHSINMTTLIVGQFILIALSKIAGLLEEMK